MVNESQARKPVQEFTEFIEKPALREATRVQTQYVHQNVHEQPIKLKEHPIQQIEQNTVIKQQPIIHRTQEIQVEQEKPIEIVKKNVTHEVLPPIEEKTMFVQPVRSADTQMKTVQAGHSGDGCSSTDVQVTAASREAEALAGLSLADKGQHNLLDKVKEKVGGAKQSAHGALETAREKAREVFGGHGQSKDETALNSQQTTTQTTQRTGYSQ